MSTKHTDNRARADLDSLEGHLEEQLERVRQVRDLLARGERAAAANLLRGHVYLDVTQLASARITLDLAHERSLEDETADDYSRRKPETRVGGAWSRRSRGD